MSRLSVFLRAMSRGDAPSVAASDAATPHDPRWDGQLLPLVSHRFPVAVCWSAKAGCTTVLKWFLAHHGLLDEARAYSSWVHDYREQQLCAGHGYRRLCERLFSHDRTETFIVKVIRDPARRAVSSFLHLLRCQHHRSWCVGDAVQRWKEDVGLGWQRGLSFRQFLRYVAHQQRQGRVINHHFRPQYEPLQDPWVSAIVPLESLATRLAEIERIHGLPHVDVGGLSDSSHHNPPSSRCDWPGLPATFAASVESLETLGTPSPELLLDPDTFGMVREVYHADYEAYAKAYPDTSEISSLHRPLGTRDGDRCRPATTHAA